jgi:hypothetical protein
MMLPTPPFHFFNQLFMAPIQSPQSPDPTFGFWMLPVAFFVFSQNCPNGMELAVLGQQMLPA